MIRIEGVPPLAAKLLASLKPKTASRSPRTAPALKPVPPAPAGLLPNPGIAVATSRR
jgi:hypothetical protein